MKDRIIPIKNPALPFYHSDVKSKIKDTIEVTYNTNAFYIFCKNFELVTAQVYKFSKLKNDKQNNNLLKERGNVLRVYFHSPINKALPQYESLPYRYEAWNDQADNGGLDGKKLSPFTRKAGYHYGWDWGPRLVTSGIWRPVKLQGWNELRLEDVFHRQTEVSSEAARVETQVEIEAAAPVENAVVTVSDGKRVLGSRNVQLHAGMNRVSVPFTIDHPELWWCRGISRAEMCR